MPELKPTLLSSEWMDAEETMRALGIKQRTLQEWTQHGFLKFKRQTREGKRPERMYDAGDVRRLQREGRPAIEKTRNDAETPRKAAPPRPALVPIVPDKTVALFNQLLETWQQSLTRAIAPPPPAAVPVTQKLWLTITEACEYGFARADLLQLIRSGKVKARKSGGWRIARKSLEAFKG
jgi:DNA-binding transcriptional MerR regulator